MNVQTVGLVGAGQMGRGIAQVCAVAGSNVILNDIDDEAIRLGLLGVEAGLARMVSKGTIAENEVGSIRARISGSTEVRQLAACELVIEAATERMQIK